MFSAADPRETSRPPACRRPALRALARSPADWFAPLIGTLLLALTALYVLRSTSVLGAVLLTGYFGGACAVNMRAGFSPFETLFPVLFGILMWAPLYLLEPRVRALIPLRRA